MSYISCVSQNTIVVDWIVKKNEKRSLMREWLSNKTNLFLFLLIPVCSRIVEIILVVDKKKINRKKKFEKKKIIKKCNSIVWILQKIHNGTLIVSKVEWVLWYFIFHIVQIHSDFHYYNPFELRKNAYQSRDRGRHNSSSMGTVTQI